MYACMFVYMYVCFKPWKPHPAAAGAWCVCVFVCMYTYKNNRPYLPTGG